MGYRKMSREEVYEILRRWHRGQSVSRIAETEQCDRKTIQKYISQGAPQYKAEYVEGEAVKITDGPFNDFLGTVQSIDEDRGKVEVLVSIFGRETPVELDFLQVQKV